MVLEMVVFKNNLKTIYFGRAGSSLLRRLFSGRGEQGLLSSFSWVLGRAGFSCCDSQALEHSLNSWGAWT